MLDVVFPKGYGEVFATCAAGDVRVWHTASAREVLRIEVRTASCTAVAFMPDGGAIISGWSDGAIRIHAPQSGTLLHTVLDAHPGGVASLCGTNDGGRVISGGTEGTVRVWRLGRTSWSATMEASVKEHHGAVHAIALRANDTACVTAADDGCCIVWDLSLSFGGGGGGGHIARRASLLAPTFFKGAAYHPDESQIVTAGSDRRLAWWDASSGESIRSQEGSTTATIHAVAVSGSESGGEVVVASGGGDALVNVVDFDTGDVRFVGRGHSGRINKIAFAPDSDGRCLVSMGHDNAVFIWTRE